MLFFLFLVLLVVVCRSQPMAIFVEMWSQIDISHRARREVIMLRNKLQESENLVAATIEAGSVEAHKLRDLLESLS